MNEEVKISKVALLTDGVYPLVLGGMQKHSLYLLKHLLSRGIEVHLFHPGGKGNLREELTDQELMLFREHLVNFPLGGGIPGSYLRQSYLYSLSIADELVGIEDIDFIYTQGFAGWALLDRKRKGAKLPVIGLNFHGLEMFQRSAGLKQKLIQWMFKKPVTFNLQHADVVYSLGGKLTTILKRLVDPIKISVVPIGLDTNWYRSVAKDCEYQRKQVLFIGRYERRKGIEELNQVIRSMGHSAVDFHFVGPMPRSKKLELANVTYHGKVMDTSRLKAIIDECQAVIVPSYAEGMPTVILEAMARGLAVIATDVGAVSQLVDRSNGWLLANSAPTTIVASLEELIKTSNQEIKRMGEVSKSKFLENYTWDYVITQTLDDIKARISKSKIS